MKLKKKENKGGDGSDKTSGNIGGSTLAVFFFIFMFGLALIPGGTARADTVYITVEGADTRPGEDYGYGYVVLDTNIDAEPIYNYGDQITLNYSIYYSKYGSYANVNLECWLGSEMESMWYGDGSGTVWGGDQFYSAHTFNSGVTSSGTVNITGYVNFPDVYSPLYVNWSLPFTVNAPAVASTVTVTATNVNNSESSSSQITVNAGTPVNIKWTTQNATGKYFDCTYPGGTCGTSYDNVEEYWNGIHYTPGATTTYTVTERQ